MPSINMKIFSEASEDTTYIRPFLGIFAGSLWKIKSESMSRKEEQNQRKGKIRKMIKKEFWFWDNRIRNSSLWGKIWGWGVWVGCSGGQVNSDMGRSRIIQITNILKQEIWRALWQSEATCFKIGLGVGIWRLLDGCLSQLHHRSPFVNL